MTDINRQPDNPTVLRVADAFYFSENPFSGIGGNRGQLIILVLQHCKHMIKFVKWSI